MEFQHSNDPDFPFPIVSYALFDARQTRKPSVRFDEPRWKLPTQPAPLAVEASYVAWIVGPKVYSGSEIDYIRALNLF